MFSRSVLLSSIAVCTVVMVVRQLGALQKLELNFFDQMVQLRPDEGPDPRLLVVTLTEEDLRTLGTTTASDQTLDQLLQKLEQYQPRVIGLDIYRDLPVEPGNAELATRLQLKENIIAVCKVGDSGSSGVPPPPTVPKSRLGFSDIVVDPNGVVRRSLLFLTPESNSLCPANSSFGIQLALQYLEKEGISAKLTEQEYLQIGSKILTPIKENTGGYQNIDARGYQVLLNYRSQSNVARQVSLTDVMAGRIDPIWVRDRIVLIGVTAPSIKDYFSTPYSSGEQDLEMSGVLVHAQMVSQILSAVLDDRPLFWVWAEWGEVVWIWGWSVVGVSLAWRIRKPLRLGLGGVVALVGLVGLCYVILTQAGWIPLVPPALGLVAPVASIIVYKTYRGIPASTGSDNIATTETNLSQPDSSELITKKLGQRYKVINHIGAGGFGRTYLAEDTLRPANPQCVVKQLVPAHKDEDFLQLAQRLFDTEAETLEKLGRHDQIPQLLAYFQEDKEFYLVQDFIEGHSLRDELLGKRLPESQVVALLKDILGILDFIHSYGVIHRDIKPSNIIRRKWDGRLVLIDFGAVKQLHTQIADAVEGYTIGIGTSGFAPPEQVMGQPAFSSDIYALGIVGIQAVTGRSPTQLQKDTKMGEVIWRDYAQVSDELAAILDKMVRSHPRERYQSAVEVLQALQHL